MAFSSSSRPSLRGRVLARLPATLMADGGLAVNKVNGVWTFSPNWSALDLETTLPDAEVRQLWVYNTETNVYTRMTLQALVADLPDGPAGTAATIAAGTTTTLAEGASATAANGGTAQAAVLNFGIPRGAIPAVGFTFSTTTTDSDPGNGIVRFNNATPASVTAIYFDNLDRDGNTVTAWLDSFDDSTNTAKGTLTFTAAATPSTKLIFSVSGSVVDGTGYRKVTVSHSVGTTLPSNTAHLGVAFSRTGDKGADGAGAGDMIGANNLAAGAGGVASAATAFANIKQAATSSATGVVELATDTEAKTGTDTVRALTPANVAAVLALDVQTFTSSGTWTKPSPTQGRFALVQFIGAAGGGARRSSGNGSGGGGGSYFERLYPLSSLGVTETVTIGAGGAVQSTDNTDGNNGGTSSFGTLQTIYGGRGGTQAAAGNAVSGGGGALHWDGWTAGGSVASGNAPGTTVGTSVLNTGFSWWGAPATGVSAANAVQTFGIVAFNGAAGGAGHSSTGPVSGVANTSQNGGNGGAGNGAGAGGAGVAPGGGGGSGTTQGGAGAAGRIIVTVF